MSRIWNPLAFDIFGNPNPIVAPPQLLVQGGRTLTEVQALSAQNVFAKFCNSARLSSVPNPTEYGQLPDGSQYKIVDVAGNRTMLVWASEGDGGSEEGGGMICLPPSRPNVDFTVPYKSVSALFRWASSETVVLDVFSLYAEVSGDGSVVTFYTGPPKDGEDQYASSRDTVVWEVLLDNSVVHTITSVKTRTTSLVHYSYTGGITTFNLIAVNVDVNEENWIDLGIPSWGDRDPYITSAGSYTHYYYLIDNVGIGTAPDKKEVTTQVYGADGSLEWRSYVLPREPLPELASAIATAAAQTAANKAAAEATAQELNQRKDALVLEYEALLLMECSPAYNARRSAYEAALAELKKSPYAHTTG